MVGLVNQTHALAILIMLLYHRVASNVLKIQQYQLMELHANVVFLTQNSIAQQLHVNAWINLYHSPTKSSLLVFLACWVPHIIPKVKRAIVHKIVALHTTPNITIANVHLDYTLTLVVWNVQIY